MNLAGIRKEFIAKVTPLYDTAEAQAMFNYLLRERFDWKPYQWRDPEMKLISVQEEEVLRIDLLRLSSGEPVQYVLGYAWFNGLKIGVNPHVLIPRPETEELALLASRQLNLLNPVILDACTGSGCIALYLQHRFPSARVFALDFSIEALETAGRNAKALGLDVSFFHHDVLERDALMPQAMGQVDLLISNPPYVVTGEANSLHRNVIGFEPHLALFVPDEDPVLFYRALAEKGKWLLRPGGGLWFETGISMTGLVANLLEQYGYTEVQVLSDISGHPRFVKGYIPD